MSETKPAVKFWCMGCGAYEATPCDEIGHISRKVTRDKPTYGPTVVAVNYLGRLQHLPIRLPGE